MNEQLQYLFAILSLLFLTYGFYIQLYMLMRDKHANSYSLDTQILTIVSMVGYTVYNVYYISMRKFGFVPLCDLLTSLQILALSVVILALSLQYPRRHNALNCSTYCVLPILFAMNVLYFVVSRGSASVPHGDFFLFFGISNCFMEGLQNLYQIALNYDRKSCDGFAIEIVAGEMLGALLMLAEQLLQSVDSGEELKLPKLVMAGCMLLTGGVVVYQKYACYRETESPQKTDDNCVMASSALSDLH